MKFTAVRVTTLLFVALFLVTASVQAGPPLVCHTFDIGNAKSLPWTSHGWSLADTESYDTKNLASDTIAILDADSTVLVHMETLRRAMLYGQKDPGAGKQLLVKLVARADAAGKGTPAGALALFDVGYLAETYSQYQWVYKTAANPAQGLEGYARVKLALAIRGSDPQMEFAAALMTLDAPAAERQEHTQKAFAGAKSDALLARNLSAHFQNTQSETMSQMISRTPNVKVAQQ
jgi:hypothetical protein